MAREIWSLREMVTILLDLLLVPGVIAGDIATKNATPFYLLFLLVS